MTRINMTLSRISSPAPLVLRLAIGGLMTYHGFGKLRETALGIISSGPMPGAELDIALLAGLVALLMLGPGDLSADRAVGLEPALG